MNLILAIIAGIIRNKITVLTLSLKMNKQIRSKFMINKPCPHIPTNLTLCNRWKNPLGLNFQEPIPAQWISSMICSNRKSIPLVTLLKDSTTGSSTK